MMSFRHNVFRIGAGESEMYYRDRRQRESRGRLMLLLAIFLRFVGGPDLEKDVQRTGECGWVEWAESSRMIVDDGLRGLGGQPRG
jgi:hypothetical protein